MFNERIYEAETLAVRATQFARGESAWWHSSIKLLGRLPPEIVLHDHRPGEEWALVRRMSDREVQVNAAIEEHSYQAMVQRAYEQQMRIWALFGYCC